MGITIKNNIRRLRFEHGEISQQKLARLTGCTRQTINAIEAAKYVPSLELAFKISDVFSVGIEEVFDYEVINPAKADSPAHLP